MTITIQDSVPETPGANAGAGAGPDELREQVRARYAAAALAVTAIGAGGCGTGRLDAGCCTGDAGAEALDQDSAAFGAALYTGGTDTDALEGLPAEAVAASLGCGNPLAVADVHPGERVLDLGSGGGIDMLLSARRVGPTGFAYGVDMTDEMPALARANAARAGATNVQFVKGTIEDIPLPDDAVDVVISNCVINLSVDKPAVISEMFRVLAPGGRVGVSDVVAEDHIPAADRAALGTYAGCIAGALSRGEYLDLLAGAGFTDATVTFTHEAAPGMHAAIIRATKPADSRATPLGTARTSTDVVAGCCSNSEHASCCAADSKNDCCGQTPAQAAADGPPTACGCQ